MNGRSISELRATTALLLKRRQWTICVAESCTGGLLGAALTELPGSSGYFHGGLLVYCDAMKARLLGVPAELLAREGAVSGACARAMAAGAQRCCGCDVALAVTGVAGPGSDSRQTPVGTVWLGLVCADRHWEKKLNLCGTRGQIRRAAVRAALEMLILMIEDNFTQGE